MNREQYLLTCLAEECAEVIQRATKAARFGIDEVEPEQNSTNRRRLAAELVDLLAVIEMLEDESGLIRTLPMDAIVAKKVKVFHFMKYSRDCGTLTD